MGETVDFSIDDISELWKTRERLLLEIAEREHSIEQLDEIIKGKLPQEDHVTAFIDGRPVFTYAYTQRWREARFREENPHLFEKYRRSVLKDTMDWETFQKDHPVLAKQYQVQSLVPTRPKRRS